MPGRWGWTPPNNGMLPAGPAQMEDIYEFWDALVGEPRDTALDLPDPLEGPPGRIITILDSGRVVGLIDGQWKTIGGAVPEKVEAQTTAIGATAPNSAWNLQSWAGIALDLPAACIVELALECWLAVTGASNDLRADIVVSGATTVAAQSSGWGAVAFGGPGTTRSLARKTLKLNAGLNTIRVATWRTVVNSGTFDVSQATVSARPLRFA